MIDSGPGESHHTKLTRNRSRKRKKDGIDSSHPSSRRRPLFSFPAPSPNQTGASAAIKSSSTDSSLFGNPWEEIEGTKKWVEFDFSFAKKHFGEMRQEAEEEDGRKLTAKERIERYNKRNMSDQKASAALAKGEGARLTSRDPNHETAFSSVKPGECMAKARSHRHKKPDMSLEPRHRESRSEHNSSLGAREES